MKAAELAGVVPFLKEHPYNLPFSMRKFVTIASVLAMDSSVIILDEPTAGQDLLAMERLGAIIRTLTAEGKTVITITHDMEFVVNNFDSVIVMANRKKIAEGNKRDIFWNTEVLMESMLKQPHISRVSRTLQLEEKILSIDEMIHNLQR